MPNFCIDHWTITFQGLQADLEEAVSDLASISLSDPTYSSVLDKYLTAKANMHKHIEQIRQEYAVAKKMLILNVREGRVSGRAMAQIEKRARNT